MEACSYNIETLFYITLSCEVLDLHSNVKVLVAHPLYSVYMSSQQIYCGNTYEKHGDDRCTYIMYIHGDDFNVLKLLLYFALIFVHWFV